MTTNARNLRDPSQSTEGFSKLPTPGEVAAMIAAEAAGGQAPSPSQGQGRSTKILGKFESQADLENAYKNLEQRLGTQGQEIGQLRSLTDKLLELNKGSPSTASGQKPSPVTSDELLRDPQATIERVVAERSAPIEAQLANERLMRIKAEFNSRHPNFEQDMHDPAMHTYINADQGRMHLAKLTVAGDLQAADSLWSSWESEKARTSKGNGRGTQDEQGRRAQELRDAAMVTGGGSAHTNDGDVSGAGATIYSRADLLKMRMERPNDYYSDDFQKIIMKAAQEKRIR